ncbi:MAG: 5'/3'-nucleotidase SurE [Acidobacteria bacterium]|nr:5'/3'-nucleotidase SurE [Acidobacteriota bacterium]
MNILLTNDDGIGAPGLATLLDAVAGLGEVVVVAPQSVQSGASHAMTDRTPLKVVSYDLSGARSAHAVEGKPADCTRLGLCHYATSSEWVISGINAGGNLGVDAYYSGTVGAAREAAILGHPAIALSQYIRDAAGLNWERSGRWAAEVIGQIMTRGKQPGLFWNVNLPHPLDDAHTPAIVVAPLAAEPHMVRYHQGEDVGSTSVFHYRGRYQDRPRPRGSDVDVVFGGDICVTPMLLDVSACDLSGGPFNSPAPCPATHST